MMKHACVISIGNELLAGRTADTNSSWLGQRLLELGLPVVRVFQVPDEIVAITQTIRQAFDSADLVILTGGLGPTDDDVTRQAVSRYLDQPLCLDQACLDRIEAFFQGLGHPMPDRNRTQAMLPHGTEPIVNPKGTAPGVLLCQPDRCLAALPGVPHEMKTMFDQTLVPLIRQFIPSQFVKIKRLKCFGEGESRLVDRLGDRMSRDRNPLINCTVSDGTVTLHIIASSNDEQQAEEMIHAHEMDLRALLGDLVFGTDDQTLAHIVVQGLRSQGKTLALAESCTGGLVAKMITDIPGASGVFFNGWITYSNQAKVRELNVQPDLVDLYGAVSEQVAAAMARGARQKSGADLAIGITGIAGPGGATPEKPVGLVYIALDKMEDCCVSRFILNRDRKINRYLTAQISLNMIRKELSL